MSMSDSQEPEQLECGRKLFAKTADFVTGAANLGGLPPPDLPEVAFIGRSNVGKSSLVNALTGRKTLARVSKTPGRTQQINFFNLGNRLMLVDLPGYGFARAPRSVVMQWTELVMNYLRGRVNLARVHLLIDGRHGPNKVDLEVMDMLDLAGVSYWLVLTKTDKVRSKETMKAVHLKATEAIHYRAPAFPKISLTSSEKRTGIAELRADIASLATSS